MAIRQPFSPQRLAAAAALLVAACSGNRAIPAPHAPWVLVNSSPKLTVSVDTSRIASDSGALLVWLRFDYAEPNPPMREVPRPWRRMELREAVDCRDRRGRDLAMMVIDTVGHSSDGTRTLRRAWMRFEAHPLGVKLFEPLCSVLIRMAVQSGAGAAQPAHAGASVWRRAVRPAGATLRGDRA